MAAAYPFCVALPWQVVQMLWTTDLPAAVHALKPHTLLLIDALRATQAGVVAFESRAWGRKQVSFKLLE